MAGKKFIKQAIKKPGALHAQLGIPQGKKIPAGKLKAAAAKGGKLGQRARFAETLKGLGGRTKEAPIKPFKPYGNLGGRK